MTGKVCVGGIYYDTVSIEVYDRVEALKIVGWKIKLGGSITTLFLYKCKTELRL